jgi:uncharacterized protein (TIGR01777 family)
MSQILITGGTGLLGSALTRMLLGNGHKVIILSRTKRTSNDSNITYALWDVKDQTIDESAVSAADYVFHLAGANVADKRWTDARKKEILESRTQSGTLLVKAIKETANKVKAVICASAIGFYGDDKKRTLRRKVFTEEMRPDDEFLGQTCRLWEESVQPLNQTGKRLVKLRIGIVLSNDGGALPEFKKPVRFGIAGVLGSGKQVVSWIHIEDLCRMFIFAMENEDIQGVYNAVAPTPVSNKELTLLLAEKMKGRFFVPLHVPALALKIGIGQLSEEVLKSATVSAEKIRTAGFTFLYPSIECALNSLVKAG